MLPRPAVDKHAVHVDALTLVQFKDVFFVAAIMSGDFDGDAFIW